MTNKKKAILFFVFLGIFLIGLFFLSNYFYGKLTSRIIATQNGVFETQNNINILGREISQLTNQLNNQTQTLTALQQIQKSYNPNQWHMLEADFLIKLAVNKIQFDNNIPEAILLFRAADDALREVNDPALLPIRKAIAGDLANLGSIPTVDIPGIYMRLSALNDQINKLPLPNTPSQTTQNLANSSEKLPWWKRGLEETWRQLRQIVIIRYNPKGSLPLILPEQRDFLLQNIHAMLEKAMWALLHKQPIIYRDSLTQANLWISRYFILSAPETQYALKELTQLSKAEVKPTLPKNLATPETFKAYLSSVHQ